MNLIQQFPDIFISEALNFVGCEEPKSKKLATQCFIDIITYDGHDLSTDAWCAKFVWYILDKTCKKIKKTNPLKYTASTLAMKKDAESKNIQVDREPAEGSIMFKYRTGGGHVGIVSHYDKATGKFDTIDGNHSDKVAAVKRQLDETKYYFIHVEKLFKTDILVANFPLKTVLIAGGAVAGSLIFLSRK